jgi:ATP-dependent DNA ligase
MMLRCVSPEMGAKLTSRLSALAHRESTYRGGGSPRWIKVKNRKHSA